MAFAAGCAAIATVAATGAGDAGAQVRAARSAPAHICAPGAEPLYACRFGRRTVSVCAQDDRLFYHFGTTRRRELTIAPGERNENVHYGVVVGQGGGSQSHYRFTNGDTDYIVYHGVDGQLADRPGRSYSGLAVMRGTRNISSRECAAPLITPAWEANARRVRQETEGSIFDGWF